MDTKTEALEELNDFMIDLKSRYGFENKELVSIFCAFAASMSYLSGMNKEQYSRFVWANYDSVAENMNDTLTTGLLN